MNSSSWFDSLFIQYLCSLDPERVHSLDRPAEECERIAGSKRRQQEGRDPGGFTCWADSTRRNYDKSVRALAPNIDVAAEQREREAVYSILYIVKYYIYPYELL